MADFGNAYNILHSFGASASVIVGCFIVSETAFVTFNYSFVRQAKLAVQSYLYETCCCRRRCCGDEKFHPNLLGNSPQAAVFCPRADTLVGSLVGPSLLIPVSSLPLFLHISAPTSGQYQPVHGARVHIRRGDVQPPPALGKV